jgi:hypothetical protein
MPVKTPVKKTTKNARQTKGLQTSGLKPVKKTVKKTSKKITLDDLLKSQDEAWKAIRETQQAVKETHDSIFGLDKAKDEAWAAIRETQKNIGGLNNTLGSLVERLMTPALPQKFKSLGFTFDKITTVKWAAKGYIYAEIDGLLENGTQAMAVEVKTTLEIEDINEHLKRMERIRKYADEHGDKREFLCAMSAMIIKPKPKEYALKQGLFVIEPSGEDVKVIKPEGKVRVW